MLVKLKFSLNFFKTFIESNLLSINLKWKYSITIKKSVKTLEVSKSKKK